ncbi:MAG: hypothetical protein HYR85_02515 [Planctomycetes bacterium]|nr:hypothetical protein [Planctomycetota bacterium]MBI3845463.1 hypothetical protein [Planctomycetota bacterium]
MTRTSRVTTVSEACELLETLGLLTVAPVSPIASLVRAVGGPSTTANWWGHPAGKKIYSIALGLEESADVFGCKLVGGKLTIVHRRLWPALHALVVRVTSREPLPPDARRLLREIEQRGAARTTELRSAIGLEAATDRRRFQRAKDLIESRLLVVASSEDRAGESHSHVATFRPWRSWVPADVARAARRLTAQGAVGQILRAAIAASGPVDDEVIVALFPIPPELARRALHSIARSTSARSRSRH